MLIPRHWSKAEGEGDDPEGKRFSFRIWGWSDLSAGDAATVAKRRLSETCARVAKGTLFDEAYFYGKTPLREEVVKSLDVVDRGAVVTRNRYGALVLNTSRVPFIDVDDGTSSAAAGLERVRGACARHRGKSFRVYRTAAGYRVLASDVLLDPKEAEAQRLLEDFGSDPYFVKLCRLQGSFRARLTPKPWRCGWRLPPGQYPREDARVLREFQSWLEGYEKQAHSKATCSLVETLGPGQISPEAAAVVTEHDRVSRTGEKLPLA